MLLLYLLESSDSGHPFKYDALNYVLHFLIHIEYQSVIPS